MEEEYVIFEDEQQPIVPSALCSMEIDCAAENDIAIAGSIQHGLHGGLAIYTCFGEIAAIELDNRENVYIKEDRKGYLNKINGSGTTPVIITNYPSRIEASTHFCVLGNGDIVLLFNGEMYLSRATENGALELIQKRYTCWRGFEVCLSFYHVSTTPYDHVLICHREGISLAAGDLRDEWLDVYVPSQYKGINSAWMDKEWTVWACSQRDAMLYMIKDDGKSWNVCKSIDVGFCTRVDQDGRIFTIKPFEGRSEILRVFEDGTSTVIRSSCDRCAPIKYLLLPCFSGVYYILGHQLRKIMLPVYWTVENQKNFPMALRKVIWTLLLFIQRKDGVLRHPNYAIAHVPKVLMLHIASMIEFTF